MLYLLTRRLFGEKVALVTAVIASLYAYFIFYGVTLVTETPFVLGLLLTLYLAYDLHESPAWWKWPGLGIALAVTLLFRMAVIFYVPFLLLWIIYKVKAKSRWQALIPVGIIILAVLPFAIRNSPIPIPPFPPSSENPTTPHPTLGTFPP